MQTRGSYKSATVYYGDVLDDSGSVMCEGGPIPLDEKTNQMVERYRMEARAAQKLHTAPIPSDSGNEGVCSNANSCQNSQSGSRNPEILVDYEASTAASERPAEEGIKEVDLSPPTEEAAKPANLSPLTTASSLGMAAYIHQNGPDGGVEEPSSQNYTNFLFLDSLASDNIIQSRQTEPHQESPSEPGTSTDCLNENHVNVIFSREEARNEPQTAHKGQEGSTILKEQEPPSSAGSGSQQPDSAQQLARQHSSKLAFLPAKSSGGQLHSQEIRPPCRQPSELPNTRKKFESKFPILPELKVPRSSYEGEVEAVDTAEQLNNGAASWTTDEATFKPHASNQVRPSQDNRKLKAEGIIKPFLERGNSVNHARSKSNGSWSHSPDPSFNFQGHVRHAPAKVLAEKENGRRTVDGGSWRPEAANTSQITSPVRTAAFQDQEIQGQNAGNTASRLREPSSPLLPLTQTNQRAIKRVHFTPEKAKLLNGRTDSFGAQQAKPMRRNLPPLQLGHEELLSRDAARQTTLWSKENDGMLEEALALSAALPKTDTQQRREAPRLTLSPSRFLQIASRPTEGPYTSGQYTQSPAWGDQVSMHMELAGNLSNAQHNESRSKARNWKLQCLRQQPVTPPSPTGSVKESADVRRSPNFSETLAAFNEPQAALPLKQPAPRRGIRSSRKLERFFSKHQASHSSTTTLIKEATGKKGQGSQAEEAPRAESRVSSFVAGRLKMLQAHAAKGVLTSSKTGPPCTSQDWEQSTLTSFQDQATCSVPPSPSSVTASIHGHALSHVTYSPSRASGSCADDAWAPDMEAVKEGDEEGSPEKKTLAEMSALSFRPAVPSSPPATLTQATLESRAVLDTVACDVDLGPCTSIWPSGHTPSSKGQFAPDSGRLSTDRALPRGEPAAPSHPAVFRTGQPRRQLQSLPWGYRYQQHDISGL